MRRSMILSTVLATSVAVLGACTPKTEGPNKPAVTTTPAPVSSPSASPVASPVVSPQKPGASPEVKKPDDKTLNKDTKPAAAETPKGK